MANFFISAVVNEVNSKKNTIINTFKNHPLYSVFDNEDNTSWKKDKISSRLNDLTVQKSGYNEVIPTLYGTNRIAGNIIWASDIREVQNTYVTSYKAGKGGKKVYQNNIEYYYYANIAIGICKGEVTELSKVWADTDLIDISKYTYRFYKGTEDQEPDSLIQSFEGIEKTPAYRGLCYIVFENLPLAEFGNRIPNFTFEVSRTFIQEDEVESVIEGVNIIPGCGEFVYDTEIVSHVNGMIWYNTWFPNNYITRANQNNNEGVADVIVATQQLKEKLPNCKWVAPVAVWFGNSLNISNCVIEPRVEFKLNPAYPTQETRPEPWRVAGIERKHANLVSSENGKVRYGGTISDNSIVRYLKYLKEQGFYIMFYPMIFMDLQNKPWRGYLTGNVSDVENFFNKSNGYNNFILHYANLVKDYCDAFVIGSELRDLTKLYVENTENDITTRTYPAVECLKKLADSVRKVVGENVKIGYASDWSEYHHTDGGWYNMDTLWASDNIDFVGIDAYFPLTDKKEDLITKEDIKNGWTSGEGYDWLYTDTNRTKKEEVEARYAWKNIDWWWKNYHINPNGEQTEWVPQSKKIWFTEYGFASVDGTTNEPNKFYDPQSMDGGFPRFSEGKIDYFAQRRAIQATQEVWANSNMVERKFLWCWDARPYPYFPSQLNIWSDGNIWHYGHWINGKMGNLMFSNMINNLFEDAGVDAKYLGGIDIYDSIDGVVLNSKTTLNEVLSILQKVFFFDYYEKDGKIYIFSKQSESVLKIFEDELLEIEDGKYFKADIIGEDDLPYKIDISYINKDLDYQVSNTYAERVSVDSDKKEEVSLPIVITASKARQVAEKLLYSNWLERNIYHFKLLPKYLYLSAGDVITLNVNNIDLILRIVNILVNEDNTIEVKAVKCDNSLYNFKNEEENFDNITLISPTSKTIVEVFELPAIKNTETPEVFFATNGEEDGWTGCAIYSAKTGSSNFNVINENRVNSNVGMCLNKLGDARPYYFDYNNVLYVSFASNIDTSILENAEMFDFLDGVNTALIGNEIIQFRKIELQSDGSFKISQLLRGQFGTEEYISKHVDNEKIIILNENIVSSTFANIDINMSYDFKIITFKDTFENSTDKTLKIEGKNLKELKPVHIKTTKNNNGYKITWICRRKGQVNWVDGEETVYNRNYILNILNRYGVVRSVEIQNETEWLYTNEMIAEDSVDDWGVEII